MQIALCKHIAAAAICCARCLQCSRRFFSILFKKKCAISDSIYPSFNIHFRCEFFPSMLSLFTALPSLRWVFTVFNSPNHNIRTHVLSICFQLFLNVINLMLSSMIEVDCSVLTALDFSCSLPLLLSCSYIEANTRLLSRIARERKNHNSHSTYQWRHMLIPLPTAPSNRQMSFFVRIWIYRKAKRVNANARHTCGLLHVITFNDYTTILCGVCVSIYAFLICRWLKRKSPVAHELRAAYALEHIRVACKKIKIIANVRAPHTRNAISTLLT